MFTDDDVKNLRNFAEMVSTKAKFELDWADAVQLAKYYSFIQGLVRKINDNVMELRAIHTPAPESTASKKSKKAS